MNKQIGSITGVEIFLADIFTQTIYTANNKIENSIGVQIYFMEHMPIMLILYTENSTVL